MGLWDDFYQTQMKPTLPTAPLPQVMGASVLSGGHVGDTYSDNAIFRANHPDAAAKDTGEHPLITLIKGLLAPKPATVSNNQGGLTSLLTALRNDPVGDYNKLSSLPSNAPNSLSPFNTGFFKTGAERHAIEQSRYGSIVR